MSESAMKIGILDGARRRDRTADIRLVRATGLYKNNDLGLSGRLETGQFQGIRSTKGAHALLPLSPLPNRRRKRRGPDFNRRLREQRLHDEPLYRWADGEWVKR